MTTTKPPYYPIDHRICSCYFTYISLSSCSLPCMDQLWVIDSPGRAALRECRGGGGGGGYEPLEDTLCPCLHRTLHYTSIVLYYLRNAFIPTLEGPKKEFLFLPPTRDSAVESPGLFSEWIIANVSYPLTWLYYILQLYSPCTSLL